MLPPMRAKPAVAAFSLLLVMTRPVHPCTTLGFVAGSEVLVGKNYDWDIGDGMVVVNKRGVIKQALVGVNPARWTSRFGSVTFNQYGREFPSGGMNEAGLVVELMWLEATRYPTDPATPGLGSLEWIQYQLDTADGVAELVENARRLRIASDAKLHYLACDPSGACAAVEYLGGRAVVSTGAGLPLRALTNDTYSDSLAHARRMAGLGGSQPIPAGEGSLERFARGAALARAFAPTSAAADAAFTFGVMDAVRQRGYTQWTIVYDLVRRELAFTTLANPQPRWVALGGFDFDCGSPVLVADIQEAAGDGANARFNPYTPEANHALVARSFATTPFLQGTPPEVVDALAAHPDSMTCVAAP
jgi:penicillin V acylase-like amidase (Ntn superfamily)